jgi:UDP-GlcNAc:undecaprenyl-phosphate GlcNAc-1-phosphate transferase
MVFCGDPGTDCGALWAQFLAVPFTVFALVGVTNAVNLSDGLDGLAAGTVLMAMAAMGLLAYEGGDMTAVVLALVLSGVLFGFLRFNTHPARVFMGDTGSQLLGYSAGVLAVMVTQTSSPAISVAVPLLLLALPLVDTVAVMVRRLLSGQSPFRADRSHVHHRLLALGLDHYEVVFVIYLGQGALVVLSLFLRYFPDVVVLGTFLALAGAAVAWFWLAEHQGWQVARPGAGETRVGRLVHFVRRAGIVTRLAAGVVALLTPLLVVSVVIGATVPRDVFLATVLLLLLSALGILVGRGRAVAQFGLYPAAALVAFLAESSPGWLETHHVMVDGAFGVLAMAVALMMRFAGGTFRLSTLDFLVVFVALLVPPALEGLLPGADMGGFVLKFILLCYAAELIHSQGGRPWQTLQVVLLASGLLVALGSA